MFNNFFQKFEPFMRQCEKMIQPDRPQMTIWRKRIAYWTIKATATHSEYVMQYLTDFPRQQYLRGRASKLLFYVSIGLELPVHNSKQHFFISPSEIINSLHVIFHMTNGSYHTNLKTFK